MGRQFSVIASICQRLIRSSSNGGIPKGPPKRGGIPIIRACSLSMADGQQSERGASVHNASLNRPAGAVVQRLRQMRQMPSGALLIRSFSACR